MTKFKRRDKKDFKIVNEKDYGYYGFILEPNGTKKICKCGHTLDLYFGSEEKTDYNYECSKCGWVSDISRNYESKYAKELGLYEKRKEPL